MGKNQEFQKTVKARSQLAGWLLFILCALFFIASSVHNRDILTFIGSVIFLVACLVFIVPVLSASKTAGNGGSHQNDGRSADQSDRADLKQ